MGGEDPSGYLDEMLMGLSELLATEHFSVGDRVVLKTGKTPQTVTQVRMRGGEQLVCAEYFSSMGGYEKNRYRPASDYKHFHPHEKEKPVAKLYQITKSDGTQLFGTYLATNSEGKYVLEIKGTGGQIEAFKFEELEEVKPYTVAVYSTKGETHYQVQKGSVAIDEFLLFPDGTIARVKRLDTKKDGALPLTRCHKLNTTPLESVQAAPDAGEAGNE